MSDARAYDTELAACIDHTILAATTTPGDVEAAAREAIELGVAALVVQPIYARLAAELLDSSRVKSCSVVSFPFGADTVAAKSRHVAELVGAGVEEVDMVMNIGAFAAGDVALVADEVSAARSACGSEAILKLIIETAYLDEAGIRRACTVAVDNGVDWVKTSTGFAPQGATVSAVEIMCATVGERAGVKASGGIRTHAFARELLGAGATRIGCSATRDVIKIDG